MKFVSVFDMVKFTLACNPKRKAFTLFTHKHYFNVEFSISTSTMIFPLFQPLKQLPSTFFPDKPSKNSVSTFILSFQAVYTEKALIMTITSKTQSKKLTKLLLHEVLIEKGSSTVKCSVLLCDGKVFCFLQMNLLLAANDLLFQENLKLR